MSFAFFAILTTSNVSDRVPIWLGLIKILLADLSSIPFFNLLEFVTNKSSPTIWTFLPISFVIFAQAFQSSSEKDLQLI